MCRHLLCLVRCRLDLCRQRLVVGCVRLSERSGAAVAALRGAVAALLAERVPDDLTGRVTELVGVAGTVATLATLDLGLEREEPARVDGHRIRADAVEEQLARLAALGAEELLHVPGLAAGRAPVIVAGIAIVAEVMRRLEVDELVASARDLLDGAALAAAELPLRAEGDAPPGAYTCC